MIDDTEKGRMWFDCESKGTRLIVLGRSDDRSRLGRAVDVGRASIAVNIYARRMTQREVSVINLMRLPVPAGFGDIQGGNCIAARYCGLMVYRIDNLFVSARFRPFRTSLVVSVAIMKQYAFFLVTTLQYFGFFIIDYKC